MKQPIFITIKDSSHSVSNGELTLLDFHTAQQVADTFIPYMSLESIVKALPADQLKELVTKCSQALKDTMEDEPSLFHQIANLVNPINMAIA